MSTVLSELTAVGTFLLNAQRFDGYEETKSGQLALLEATILRASMPIQECSHLLEVLQQQPCWNDVERQPLGTAIQRAVSFRQGISLRSSMQDFTSLPLYFPVSLWETLMDSKWNMFGKVAAVSEFAGNLGLRNPSEVTAHLLTALFLHCSEEEAGQMDARSLHMAFVKVKKDVKGVVAALPMPADLPERLPSNLG
eukprot:s3207_g10.t1